MPRLETRRIDKNKLRGADGAHAGDAVAGGLRLAGRDADLLADQRIKQGRFTDVGLADDGNQAAALLPSRRAGGNGVGRCSLGKGLCQHGVERIR